MIRVIIERNIKDGCIEGYLEHIRQVRKQATRLDGFIAGELLQEKENPYRAIIISSWDNHNSWDSWAKSDERAKVLSEIRPFLDNDEVITILENSNALS
jgi:heme-degrading monooxygenase HmoA